MRRLLGTLGLAAGALALAGCWPVPGADPNRSSSNPWEKTLTADTVDGLTEQWRWTSPSGQITDPVLSNSGVHVGVYCGVATLDPATGAFEWGNTTGSPQACTSGGHLESSIPYVFDGPSGQRVQASSAFIIPRQSELATRDFDAATGEGAEPSFGGFLVARRGDRPAFSSVAQIGPATGERRVLLAGRSFVQDAFPMATLPSPDRGFTLGTDKVFHAGGGVLASEPGPATFGDGVRAYSITEARPGCGPRVITGPVPGSFPVECPVWATPTDAPATIPVLSPDGATVYTRTTAGTLYALDAATGAVRWTRTGLGTGGPPAVANGHVVVPGGNGQVVLFDVTSCTPEPCGIPTTFDTGSGAPVTAVAVGGDVIYAVSAGTVYASGLCHHGESCELAWSGPGSGSPVISNGQLYITQGADLIAYGLG